LLAAVGALISLVVGRSFVRNSGPAFHRRKIGSDRAELMMNLMPSATDMSSRVISFSGTSTRIRWSGWAVVGEAESSSQNVLFCCFVVRESDGPIRPRFLVLVPENEITRLGHVGRRRIKFIISLGGDRSDFSPVKRRPEFRTKASSQPPVK